MLAVLKDIFGSKIEFDLNDIEILKIDLISE